MLHIRTDGNAQIGTGHVMRCIEIAKAYEENIGPVQFLVADTESKNFIESKGFSCYVLDSVWNDLDCEIQKLVTCKEHCKVKRLLIDSYFISKDYIRAWKKLGVKVAYLDDLCSEAYEVDVLFNGALWATGEVYDKIYSKANTKLCLGCNYISLRKEFVSVQKKQVKEKADMVLVLSGGTDPYHFLLRFLENLPKDMEKECQYYLVCGIFNEDYEKITEMCQNRPYVHILQNVPDLYDYMCRADVAISAGGMTLYELSACGTPCIMYLLADNQKGNLEGFTKAGFFESIGDIREQINFEELFEKLGKIMHNYDMRLEKSRKIQKLVDGKGAYRIAEELGKLS